jgi:pimeloyl-ACP methyl ester carboxylesterase
VPAGSDNRGLTRRPAGAATLVADRLGHGRPTLVLHGGGPGRGLPQDLSSDLADVASEVLLIWGAADPFSDPRYAAEVAALLPRARVEVIEAAAHHPQSEHPARYARLAREFLDGGL